MADLVERLLSGDVRAAARACRVIDDRAPGHRELLRRIYAVAPTGYVVGVTGSPGAGKSTLVDRLVAAFRANGEKVGVVAVDPTSPFTGGAILGDRIRMQRHFEDEGVFIRSVATRGALGGLSRSARDVVRVLEAWGAGVVLLETVGVGQDELDVTLAADTTVVVLSPGQGDDVQAIKAGILECADVFVVNKADRGGADATVRDLENMLALGAVTLAAVGAQHHHSAGPRHDGGATDDGWAPPIVKAVATTNEGVSELLARLEEHRAWGRTASGMGRLAERTRGLVFGWLRDEIASAVLADCSGAVDDAARRVLEKEIDPHTAVDQLLAQFRSRSAQG